MTKYTRVLASALLIVVAGCKGGSAPEVKDATRSHEEALKRSVEEHLDKAEKAIAMIVASMSQGKVEKEEPTETIGREVERLPAEEAEAVLIKQRQMAIDRSLSNIAEAMADQKEGVGSNCHWKQVCTYWYCTKWGSTGDGGTAKCLDYACGAWEWQLVCD